MKKIILLSVLVAVSVAAFGQTVFAANSTLSILPSTASKNVGVAFNIAVRVDPQGGKVCVVKGTLSFNNLTCQSITVASGLMAQTTPTCSNPSFTLGIKKCASAVQNIFIVSVKGNSVGQAKATLSITKVLGVGAVIASAQNSGVFNITKVPTPTPASAATSTFPPRRSEEG